MNNILLYLLEHRDGLCEVGAVVAHNPTRSGTAALVHAVYNMNGAMPLNYKARPHIILVLVAAQLRQ
jgi:hypothetical protein